MPIELGLPQTASVHLNRLRIGVGRLQLSMVALVGSFARSALSIA